MLALKHAFRQLIKSPGFTFTALATLAICLGANLTIFAVIDAVLVRALPFPDPERLAIVYNAYPGAGVERAGASVPNYLDRRKSMQAFSSVAIFRDEVLTVGDTGSPVRVPSASVSPEFFATLGVPLALGHTFTDDQMAYGPNEVAVLTDAFWRNHFNADANVVGRTFLNDGIKITVIGVLPRDFRFLSSKAQFYRPCAFMPDERKTASRHSNNWSMFACLAPGVTFASAQSEMDAFNARQASDDPYAAMVKGAGYHTVVRSLHEDHVHEVKPILLLLQSGVLFLLLIGGVNLANLLLIRASGRTKELAVRQALGAGRRHIAGEVLVETTLLALGGGLLGLLLGAFGIRLLQVLGTDQLPLGATIVFDGRLAAFALGAAVLVGLVLAAPIVWFNLHSKLAPSLQAESRGGTASRAAQRLRHGFIITQVALAFVLLAGAGLLGISLQRVLENSPGFNPDNLLTGRIALPWINYKDDASRLAFIEKLLPALRTLPGITHVAIDTGLPFGGGSSNSAVIVEGQVVPPGESIRAHFLSTVSADYWPTMEIPLLQGRFFEEADNHRTPQVCVVDQAFAQRYWPDGKVVGRRLAVDVKFTEDNAITIVGVVANVKQNELAETTGHGAVYFNFTPNTPNGFTLLVRSPLPPASIAPMVSKAILQLDSGLPLDDIRPMRTRIDDSLVARRSPAILAGIFAGVALLLAAIGTYGVLAYSVNQRYREIGVRMALGARPGQIGRQFLELGLRLLAAGTIFGVIGAWLAGRAMQGVLFGVPSVHPATLLGTAIVLSIVTLIACLLPARRATKIDPMVALRAE